MSIFNTDFHCHVLPGIDDGAANLDESVALINMQMAQGVKRIVATPHFRMHEQSIEHFLHNRSAAYQKLVGSGRIPHLPPIMLSAEIALERNLYDLEGIERLGNQQMNTLLLELPFEPYRRWMSEEIEEISYETGMQVIVAHLDRYIDIYNPGDYAEILNIQDAIFQFNISAFAKRKTKKLVKQLIKDEYPIVFGTDCHNSKTRKPDFDVLAKSLKGYEPHIKTRRLFENL